MAGEIAVLNFTIDKNATKVKTRKLLSKYLSIVRMAGMRPGGLHSPLIDGMPKSNQHTNKLEGKIVKHIDARAELNKIIQALELLNETSYMIIYYSYCCEPRLTYYQIAVKIGYSSQSMDYLKAKALLEFADAYDDQALIVYEGARL